MKLINYLFIFTIVLNISSCGKKGSLSLPKDENIKWFQENDPNK